MFEEPIVQFSLPKCSDAAAAIDLAKASIFVDGRDHVGVLIAAKALAEDFGRVTRRSPSQLVITGKSQENEASLRADTAIIIGSISSSLMIQKLVVEKQIDLGSIQGKWESYHIAVVDHPSCIEDCQNALVIAGSDKRGTIFGTYTLSEQIGVSPWHWWADVPIEYQSEIFALPVTISSREPSIKFRGIFINDEAPALTGFVLEKFGKYGKEFYTKVFDLLLRLKANFLWPAMWPGFPNPGSSFFVDDAENQKTADDYGIVVSTSHHEPMQRATNEWFADNVDGSWSWLENKQKITAFFEQGLQRAKGYESYFTMGMRGEYDRSMKTDDPAAVVQDVIDTQRALIKAEHGRENAVPQLLALYKEVQEYWDGGNLKVPEDVTLLFADDNFGTLRRLPSESERMRKGGAGIYYHFEYVGTPRSYKWINSNSLGKTWHQLQQAYHRNARQIWVFNVGDIKPIEVPLSFAMALAWDINSIPANAFNAFYTSLAERELNSDLAESVASAWRRYDRLASLRRHEHIEADNFSLLHYNEAKSIVNKWDSLLKDVDNLYTYKVPQQYKASFFQLVLHPIKASTIYTNLRVRQGHNKLWALQRRNTANKIAQEVLDLFDEDFQLTEEYHSLLDGKWNHIMRQTHYGYGDTWHAPSRDMISGLCYVQRRQNSNPLVGQLGVAIEGHPGIRPGVCNEESDRTHPSRRDLVPGFTLGSITPYGPGERWFELYSRGNLTLDWRLTSPYDWLNLSHTAGRLVPGEDDIRIIISINWQDVPDDFNETVLITASTSGGNYGPYGDDFEHIHLPVINRRIDNSKSTPFRGFVEEAGYVSIPATSPVALPDAYQILPETGRQKEGSVALDPKLTNVSNMPSLTYLLYLFSDNQDIKLHLQFSMTLDVDPESSMYYEIGFDDGVISSHKLVEQPKIPGELPPGWFYAVQDCVWQKKHELGPVKRGRHAVHVKLLHSNIILEKLIIDAGGIKSSYLGPPSSVLVH